MMALTYSDLFLPEGILSGKNKILKFVIDNNEDYYIVKSVDSQKICDEIRKNNFSFTS